MIELDTAPRFFAFDGAHLVGDLFATYPLPSTLRGAFAGAHGDRFVRDPLGIQKLFWARRSDDIVYASTLRALTTLQIGLDAIYAVPPGAGMAMPDGSPRTQAITPKELREPASSLEAIASKARSAMNAYLAALPHDAPVYVCMSGGLDSSGITALVREHFPNAIGVSFDIARPGGESEDRVVARRLAKDLAIPLLEVTPTEDEVLSHLDTVILGAIDWRDFNVHAGLVNAALAQGIREHAHDDALVFTGDLANELLADYHEESYAGATYYRLPQLRGTALRDVLVRGAETSHREVGVFAAFGLTVIQPYAVAVDHYLALDDEQLESPGLKRALAVQTFGGALPAYVLDRKKSRAQVGDDQPGRGTMSLSVDRGFDAKYLRARFAELHGIPDDRRIDAFFRGGRYRCALPGKES